MRNAVSFVNKFWGRSRKVHSLRAIQLALLREDSCNTTIFVQDTSYPRPPSMNTS